MKKLIIGGFGISTMIGFMIAFVLFLLIIVFVYMYNGIGNF